MPTVAFVVTHPHDVHLFKNAIGELSDRGYRIRVFARKKEITTRLLEAYNIPHTVLGDEHHSRIGLVEKWSKFGYRLLRAVRRLDPDLLVAEVGAATSPVAWLTGTESLIFMDAEHATLQNSFVYPFATRICTSTSFWTDIGPQQVRYEGCQELAYLHPNRFDPDPSVLTEAGLQTNETFVIVRSVGWKAAHDINAGGFSGLESVIETLEQEGATVVVTSEASLPDTLVPYQLSIEPHRIHHLMYYTDLFVGESATMATESAVLGTPAVYVSTLEVGYTTEIAQDYGLIFNYSGPDRQRRGIEQARRILDGSCDTDWDARWRQLIDDKQDTTDVILNQVRDMTEQSTKRVVE